MKGLDVSHIPNNISKHIHTCLISVKPKMLVLVNVNPQLIIKMLFKWPSLTQDLL